MPTAICAYALGIGYLVNSDAGQLLIPQMVFEQMEVNRPTAKLFSDDVVVGIAIVTTDRMQVCSSRSMFSPPKMLLAKT